MPGPYCYDYPRPAVTVDAVVFALEGDGLRVLMIRRKQGLDASDVIRKSPQLARAIDAIGSGEFSPGEPSRFESIAHALRYIDHYMVSADFNSYYEAQRGIDARWQVIPASLLWPFHAEQVRR